MVRNEFPGYVVVPRVSLREHPVRLDFNSTIKSGPRDTKLLQYNLRMFVLRDSPRQEDIEIGVSLTTEQWLDLIEAMKGELEKTEKDLRDSE